jgi:hypothetical protein
VTLNVSSETEELEKALKQLGIEVKGLMRRLVRALATVAKKQVKRNMGAFLNMNHLVQSSNFSMYRGKGNLRDAVYGFARSATHAVTSSGQMYKAEALEAGADLKPKKAKYLSFQGEDGWVKSKHLVIPPKRWFSRSLVGLEDSQDYKETPEKMIGKAIKKAGLGR